jgi:5-methylcytosine-specific restriction protein A
MPYKPRRPCCYPGCPELVDKGYCDKHKKAAISDPARQRFETSALWGRIRKAYMDKHPLCEDCEKERLIVLASEVHHRDGDWRNNEESNLAGLCSSCHGKHTRGRY